MMGADLKRASSTCAAVGSSIGGSMSAGHALDHSHTSVLRSLQSVRVELHATRAVQFLFITQNRTDVSFSEATMLLGSVRLEQRNDGLLPKYCTHNLANARLVGEPSLCTVTENELRDVNVRVVRPATEVIHAATAGNPN